MSTRKRIRAFSVDAGVLELTVIDCTCGVIFGITTELAERRRKDQRDFYCPNGHVLAYSGPTQAQKEAKAAHERAERLATALRAQQDQAAAARREAAEAKASEVRLRWRVGNGVCPCCSRTFQALAAHVATKHPDFVHQDLDALSARMRELLATIRHEAEEQEAAVLDAFDLGVNMNTVRALARRGLVEQIDYHRVALTEAGWHLATLQAATG